MTDPYQPIADGLNAWDALMRGAPTPARQRPVLLGARTWELMKATVPEEFERLRRTGAIALVRVSWRHRLRMWVGW